MKIYKIKMMSGTEIPLKEEHLEAFLAASSRGGLIKTAYGIVNCSSIDSITLHKEMMREIYEQKRMGLADPEKDLLGPELLPGNDKKLLK